MIVACSPLWFAATNTYVVAAEAGGPAMVVDAPPQPDGVLELLTRYELVPLALLVTHGHVDHVGGAGEVVRRTGITAYVHPDDDFLTFDPTTQLQVLTGMVPPGDYRPPDDMSPLEDGMKLDLAGMSFTVLHTPGHTPGHCCFHLADEGLLFSGDQLFAGSIGRVDLPGGNMAALIDSMRDKVMVLDDDTRVLPGHGSETTIGRERATNPFRFDWT